MTRLATSCDVVVFCSSSGHCQLDCDYCVVHPVIKRNPSLTYDDLAWFLGEVRQRVLFMFSGKGDFFAGYAKRDRLLDRLLDHDVEVALDINGVLLQEYPEIAPEKLRKIRYINLTMHYRQLREKRVEKVWVENARTILEKHGGELLLGTILSPLGDDQWDEALEFYEREIFRPTGQRMWMIRDCERPSSAGQEEKLAAPRGALRPDDRALPHGGPGEGVRGSRPCSVRRGGTISASGTTDASRAVRTSPSSANAGNVKERRLARREAHFRCSTPHFCDCNNIEALGKMRYDAPAVAGRATPAGLRLKTTTGNEGFLLPLNCGDNAPQCGVTAHSR